MMMWGAFMMLAMVLGFVAIAVLIGGAIALIMRWIGHQPHQMAEPDGEAMAGRPSALDILRERYARGEIDTATFGDMATRLQTSNAPIDTFPSARR